MNRESLIFGLEPNALFNTFFQFASQEFGSVKVNDILKKVSTSGRVSKFILEARRINQQLGSDDFLACVHSSNHFIFAKAETIAIASIGLLIKWDHEVGKTSEISDSIYLNRTFFFILEKCDRYKTHIKNTPNFFERFNKHLSLTVIRTIAENESFVQESEVSFEEELCIASLKGLKTQFRTTENLSLINLTPNDWSFQKFNGTTEVVFINIHSEQTLSIPFPYKLGGKISLYNKIDRSKPFGELVIKTSYMQRIRAVDQMDAVFEGYGIYKDKINSILMEDPSLDAEYCLFEQDWLLKHGRESFARNEWLFVVEFEPEVTSVTSLKATANSAGLTETQLNSLLSVKI